LLIKKSRKVTFDEHMYIFLLRLLQADQLMFALHFVRGMHPELFQDNVSIRGENLQAMYLI